ncbi:hypothetical protein [Actinomyces wuliandei]|uniref:hypothetical protein n=1 Tax=Actinomyces wuliandei TaxID=2057743 RepID=UPI000FDC0F60|nr:hypothetical protein [Actinomyces wuliandei]
MTGARGSGETLGDRDARLAAARLALRRAEDSTGLRHHNHYDHHGGALGFRQPAGAGRSPGGSSLWDYLGSCPAGVLHLEGSAAVLLAAAARRQGVYGWCGVLGGEGLGWCAAAELGLDLSRVLSVPVAGLGHDSLLAAAGVLVDGVDVLLVSARAAECLGAGSRRRLLVRARDRGTLVLSPLPWQGGRTLVCERSCPDDGAPGPTGLGVPADVRSGVREGAHEVDGGAGRDLREETHGEGVVVPLRRQGVPQGALPAASSTRQEAVEMPVGYLRGLVWTLGDPERGVGGTVLTHGPHGLSVGGHGPAASAPASPAPLRGAG